MTEKPGNILYVDPKNLISESDEKPAQEATEVEYKHTEDMGEISGFGGGYEATCQNMLDAGVKWLLSNPEKEPAYKEFTNIYGVTTDENEAMKELQDILVKASGDDCTGAMMQAVSGRLMFIKNNGWQKYCEKVRQAEQNEANKPQL